MAGSTTNLGLIKPLGSEKIRIAQINQNSDTLDAAIGAVGSTSLQAQVSAIEDGIAIVANGDSHVAITAGQFVYVRNNTHNLAEGLYVASANVSATASITSSNMTADAIGGLNALNDKFPTKVYKTNMTDGESYTYTSQSAMESGLVSLATTVMGANKVRTIFLYPNFTSQIFGGAAGCATISTGGSSSYFTVLFHNYVTAVHGTYLNGTWSWERLALKSDVDARVQSGRVTNVTLAANAQTEITVTLPISYNGGNDYSAVANIEYYGSTSINSACLIRNKLSGSFVIRVYNSGAEETGVVIDWVVVKIS